MMDKHWTLSLFSFFSYRLMFFNLLHGIKSKCSVLPWLDAQTILRAPEEKKKNEATPHTLHSHSLPRLHAPSSLTPVLGPRPRLHAMLREVLVPIQQTPPRSSSASFPLSSSSPPFSFNNNLGFEFSETHTARKCDCTARTAFSLFSNSLLPPEWLDLFPLPQIFSSC